jgi:hypothetical protein
MRISTSKKVNDLVILVLELLHPKALEEELSKFIKYLSFINDPLGIPLCFIKNTKRLREHVAPAPGYNAVCGLDCMTAQCEPLWKPVDGLKGIQVRYQFLQLEKFADNNLIIFKPEMLDSFMDKNFSNIKKSGLSDGWIL